MRRALLARAKADSGLIGIVPASHIAPDGETAWPFMLIEAPTTLRLRAACVRGASVSFDIHAFARARESGESIVETGYDHVSRIGSAIEVALADDHIVLEDGSTCRIELSDIRLLKDGEPDAWHWFGQINCRVLAEAA